MSPDPNDEPCPPDFDECGVYGTCSQSCSNTNGSYSCSCVEGYLPQPDNRSCKAKNGRSRPPQGPLCHTGRGSGPSLSHKEGVWTPSVTQGGGLDQEGVWTRRGSGPLCHTSRGSGPGGGLDPSVTPGGGLDPLCHTGRGLDPILVQTPPSLTEGFQTRGSGPGGGLAQEGVWPSPPSST